MSPLEPVDRTPVVSRRYRLSRALVRVWFNLFFRNIRVLHDEALPAAGPAILVVGHPASFLDALLLVAAFDRQVRCLVSRQHLRGFFRSVLAWALGMMGMETEGDAWRSVVETCCDLLGKGQALLVFVDEPGAGRVKPAHQVSTAATIAAEAEACHGGALGVVLCPVHLFLPVKRSQSGELLIHVDHPVIARNVSPGPGSALSDQAGAIARALEDPLLQNAFRLPEDDFELFLADLEEVLRSDLEEAWTSRRDWKQTTEGFTLSQFVAECVRELNVFNPGRLVALRDSLDAYHEARRRCSLKQLEVELAGAWLKSSWRRAAVWVETLVGLPVAIYGLVNHLPSWLFLFWAGLLKKNSEGDARVRWLLRALTVLGCYAVQLLLCAYWLGRAAAGLYGPSLPVSGLVLWRYGWLLQQRTRWVVLAMALPRGAARLRRQRQELLADLDEVVHAYADRLRVAH